MLIPNMFNLFHARGSLMFSKGVETADHESNNLQLSH